MSRILLIADIHSNWPALQAINEPFDLCIFLGDLVDYGLEPSPCIDWVRKNCKYTVRGNHDHGAAQHVTVNGLSGFKFLTGITRPLTRHMLSEPERRFLMELPITRTVTIDDLRYYMCHATPRDPLDEYAPADPEFWSRRLEHIDADIVCVGHTHMPFVLEVGTKLVVNPGSVGLARDGNPRASYAILEGRKVELKRIDYPIESTVNVIKASTLPDPAKDLLIEVYRTGEAKNQKVDSRIMKPRPSNPGIPKPPAVAPAAAPDPRVVRPRATSPAIARPQQTAQGTEPAPTQDVIPLAPEAPPQPPPPPQQQAASRLRDTRHIPILRQLPKNPEPPSD
jgi:putative phosphoesterase